MIMEYPEKTSLFDLKKNHSSLGQWKECMKRSHIENPLASNKWVLLYLLQFHYNKQELIQKLIG